MMLLKNLSTLSNFYSDAKELEPRFWTLLSEVTALPEVHGRFLNSFSFLEYMGSRKIMNSHGVDTLSRCVLKHLAEEARHAAFFKQRSKSICGKDLSYDHEDMFARPAAYMYFQRLDGSIFSMLRSWQTGNKHHSSCYLWVTLAIEIRASWLYGIYQNFLQSHPLGFNLRSILAEEKAHLNEMLSKVQEIDTQFSTHLGQVMEKEMALFHRWLRSMEIESINIPSTCNRTSREEQLNL